MKKTFVALAVAFLAMPVFAADDVRGNVVGDSTTNARAVGNGNAEGEASFSMSFTGKGRTNGDFTANGNNATNGAGFVRGNDDNQ
jgi:hypothetical protein